ncbi:MAG: hypothetical protein QOC61_1284 [Acidobacteriota bacterium]|jgi:hypothetical protein|nr:hypothetical protein [Acidobacteriota bacterium]
MAESEEGQTEERPPLDVGIIAHIAHAEAWGLQQTLFSARYYYNFDKADPIAAAMRDRDFLVKHCQRANDEAAARAVEKIYEGIQLFIQCAIDVAAGRGEERDRAFLHLVPPLDKP